MAELVLGIGSSHTPMLNATAEEWARFQERDPGYPLLDKEGNEVTFEELIPLADERVTKYITPEAFAASKKHSAECVKRLAQDVADAKLDTLIIVGDDQKELFHDNNLPSYLIYYGDTITNVPRHLMMSPGTPDWFREVNGKYYDEVPTDYPVDSALALHMIAGLGADEFDVSTAQFVPEGQGEGHAFAYARKHLMTHGNVPVVPFFINTYYPPNQPTPRRCYNLGKAIRKAIESFPEKRRVGIMASGGLSHFTVDEDLDSEVIEALRAKDAAALQALPVRKLNGGSSEIRNWICVAGAVEHLDLNWIDYVPGYRSPAGTGTGLGFARWS